MESEVLAERILLDLKNVFKKDPLIDEFDILPVSDSTCNKCPVIHVEHKVALESWCVRHVYLYAYSNFLKWRQHPYKIDPAVLLSWTSAVLLINPDLETAWNVRKELMQSNQCIEKDELKFSEVVLSRKPKSPQIFAHRKWVLTRLLNGNCSPCTMNQVIEHELSLCTLTANKYSNNYYVWNHRMWIIQYLLHICSDIVVKELHATEQWVSTHVSDHSGFHYRQFLISCLFPLPNSPVIAKMPLLHSGVSSKDNELDCYTDNSSRTIEFYSLLMKEMVFLSELQLVYPGHETMWNHRRFIVHEVMHIPECAKLFLSQSNCASCLKPTDGIGNKKYKLESEFHLTSAWCLTSEESFLKKCAQQNKDNFWEHKLILKHVTWLKNVALCPVSLPCS